jgi:hypothetical protein
MKRVSFIVVILSLLLLAPGAAPAKNSADAERAWKPFIAAFRAAVRRRDREALKKMMAPDFFTSGGVGDDNGDGDSRDETFAFWGDSNTRGWEALEQTLSKATVPYTYMRDARDKTPMRVAPPAANVRRQIVRQSFEWYAIFEFRADGRWYCTVFAQCCD